MTGETVVAGIVAGRSRWRGHVDLVGTRRQIRKQIPAEGIGGRTGGGAARVGQRHNDSGESGLGAIHQSVVVLVTPHLVANLAKWDVAEVCIQVALADTQIDGVACEAVVTRSVARRSWRRGHIDLVGTRR